MARPTVIVVTLALLGCRTSEPPEHPAPSAFTTQTVLDHGATEPIGWSEALTLTRPSFTEAEVAELADSMAEIVADGRRLNPEEKLEVVYRPERPSLMVEVIGRERPRLTEPGVHPGIGHDTALGRALHCADLLAQKNVIATGSYVRDPVLERTPTSRSPAGAPLYYHFSFGQIVNGILLGNSEMTIDVDAHSGACFRIEVAFIDHRREGPVDLVVSVAEAKAAVEGDVPATGGKKVVDEGRVVYWLDPGVRSAVVEPRFVSSYSIVSESGLASRGVGFAVTLSHRPPVVTELQTRSTIRSVRKTVVRPYDHWPKDQSGRVQQ